MASRWPALLLGALVASVAGVAPLRAQEPPVDSTRIKVMERLQRLGRAPGADSLLFVRDSVRQDSLSQRRGGGVSAGADSTLAAILGLSGYAVTEYEGGRAEFGAGDRQLTLKAPEGGRARVNRDGLEVQADSSILYSEASGRVRTVGGSTFTPTQGDPVESGSLVYDLQSQRGSAVAAETNYAQGSARWKITGDMPYANTDSTFMSHARFTSCELDEPHYHFETDEIKIVGNSVLVARPVRLYFADVPVAWLPFIAQSLSQGRASGLLTPRFSVNDIVRSSGGYNRRVSNIGFYWAMSDYSDAIVAFDWFSNNFVSLTGSTAYKWNSQFLEGNLNFRQYWRQNGRTERSLNTRHSWEMSERTKFRASADWISNTDFLAENSTNPREVVQTIDSNGGIDRRFDWGSTSVQANRTEYLSDGRVDWQLPTVSLNLSTITLFPAPSARAGFLNNATVAGSASYRRNTRSFPGQDVFDPSQFNTANTTGSVSSSLSFGALTFSQGINLREEADLGIPEAFLLRGDSAAAEELLTNAAARDINRANLSWNTSVRYQQQLFGSTTFTPNLRLSGNQFRSDTSQIAQSFVSAPSRVSFGATLKTDVYGFLRGEIPEALGFEAIRHKFSPSFDYSWSPEKTPTVLQSNVFGARVLQPQNAVSVTLNQTWEAKRLEPADSTTAGGEDASTTPATGDMTGEPRRIESAPIVNLLALRTSVVRYDFVEADSAGSFLSGFETTRLTNQVSSDLLRGLTMSVEHELFRDTKIEGQTRPAREFDFHLSQLNLSFSLNNRSGIFRWLGLAGADGAAGQDAEEDEDVIDPLDPDDPFADGGATDESSMVPRGDRAPLSQQERSGSGGLGGWNASLSYALTRPRDPSLESSQMLNGTLTLKPTEHWDMSWRTAYDIERKQFNDHSIRLSRDLHRWKANFDFVNAANGNWTFRFEVSLIDNQDLKFDYEQRNLDVGLPASSR